MSKSDKNESAVETVLQKAGTQFRADIQQADLATHRRRALAAAVRARRSFEQTSVLPDWLRGTAALFRPQTAAAFAMGSLCVLGVLLVMPDPRLPGENPAASPPVPLQLAGSSAAEPVQLSLVISYEDMQAAAEEEEDSEEEESFAAAVDEDDALVGFDVAYQPLVISNDDVEYYETADNEDFEYAS